MHISRELCFIDKSSSSTGNLINLPTPPMAAALQGPAAVVLGLLVLSVIGASQLEMLDNVEDVDAAKASLNLGEGTHARRGDRELGESNLDTAKVRMYGEQATALVNKLGAKHVMLLGEFAG